MDQQYSGVLSAARALVIGVALSATLVSSQTVVAASDTGGDAGYPAVTSQRLLNAQQDDGWLMYRRDYTSRGYAPFKQIDKSNVKNLKVAFDYKTGLDQGHEAPAVVNGDYMFITTPLDHVIALDATTGKVRWKYKKDLPKKALKSACCDVVNRGVALMGDKAYIATLDNHVVALDAKTGKVAWDTSLRKAGGGYSMTLAPLAVKGKIVVGESGGEFGARGFIEALDAKTGKKAWKTYTIPAPDQPGGDTWPKGAYKTGGGAAWLTGSYDKDTDTLFWGVGNPAPWLATLRPGKNLYTNSVLALDPADGHIKWHYQWTPHGTWDYDGVNENVLTTVDYQGKKHKALVHADRNGWFYAIDRTNGKFIYAKPFVNVTSVTGFKDGVAQTNDVLRPTKKKQIWTCPAWIGGKNWWPMSIDPQTGMAYVPTSHACMTMKGVSATYQAGLPYFGETFSVKPDPNARYWGSVQGINLDTGKQTWEHTSHLPWNGGMLSTASGLVFSGSVDGYFYAFDGKTGEVLWKSQKLSSGILGVPSTYKVDGQQYVAVYAGWGGVLPVGGGMINDDPGVKSITRGGHLYVFKVQ